MEVERTRVSSKVRMDPVLFNLSAEEETTLVRNKLGDRLPSVGSRLELLSQLGDDDDLLKVYGKVIKKDLSITGRLPSVRCLRTDISSADFQFDSKFERLKYLLAKSVLLEVAIFKKPKFPAIQCSPVILWHPYFVVHTKTGYIVAEFLTRGVLHVESTVLIAADEVAPRYEAEPNERILIESEARNETFVYDLLEAFIGFHSLGYRLLSRNSHHFCQEMFEMYAKPTELELATTCCGACVRVRN